jgi:hypothetical protein
MSFFLTEAAWNPARVFPSVVKDNNNVWWNFDHSQGLPQDSVGLPTAWREDSSGPEPEKVIGAGQVLRQAQEEDVMGSAETTRASGARIRAS